MKTICKWLPVLLVPLFLSCNRLSKHTDHQVHISLFDLKKTISVLASDSLLGRAPATPGEERTIRYLARRFKEMGLLPANGGSYFQEVPLMKNTPTTLPSLAFSGSKGRTVLAYRDDFMGVTPQPADRIDINGSEVVFAGYGIVAPEYQWNDYEGVDVKGKTVLTLVNDPGFATGDTALFKGRAMTYYGRWTYKYEEAVRQGARAVMVIHETKAAAYPWQTVINSWSGPVLYLEKNVYSGTDLQFTGWLTTDAARKVFGSAGWSYDELVASASKRGFKAVGMNLQSSIGFANKTEHCTSNNVAALLPGTSRKDECVIYTAHWDHFGVKPSGGADSILNGALDNATGVAAMLEIAGEFTSIPDKPKRSVLFLAVTCEESMLLGSDYYVSHPLFPLGKTVCNINLEGLPIFGRTRDMIIIGSGNSQLEEYAAATLKKERRVASPDPMPERGSYFRSDHFSFAKKGVPALYLVPGVDNREHGKEWGMEKTKEWTLANYHMPSDNYEPEKWDFSGMTEDIGVQFDIGYTLSNSDQFPGWYDGSQFKALRR